MASKGYNVFTRQQPGQGRCRKCHTPFVGPGDRCPPCAHDVKVKAAKRRRKR